MNNQTKKIDFVAFSELRPSTRYEDTKDILLSHWRELNASDEGTILLYKYGCGLRVDIDGVISEVFYFSNFPKKRKIEGLQLNMSLEEVQQTYTKLIDNNSDEEDLREFKKEMGKDIYMTIRFYNNKLVGIDIKNVYAVHPKKEDFDFSKNYPEPTKNSQFIDKNFKLVVLSELISQGLIDLGTPEELASFVLGKYIDFDEDEKYDGYDLIPECLDYLSHYPIDNTMLSRIEEISFDGGLEIYRYIFYHWGGETEDFDVRSLKDIEKLPNLKSIEIISMVEPSQEIEESIKKLKERGVYQVLS